MIAAAAVCAVLLGPASSGPVGAHPSPAVGVAAPAPVTSSRAAAGSIDAADPIRIVPVGVAVGAAIHGAVADPPVIRGPVPFDLAVPGRRVRWCAPRSGRACPSGPGGASGPSGPADLYGDAALLVQGS